LLEKFEICLRLKESDRNFVSKILPSFEAEQDGKTTPLELRFIFFLPIYFFFYPPLSLIPSLLPEKSNVDVLWRPFDLSKIQFDRIYEFRFLPKGLFSRLIVRLALYASFVFSYWRYGIIATKGGEGKRQCIFLVEEDAVRNRITVVVRGYKTAGRVLRDITETIDLLLM